MRKQSFKRRPILKNHQGIIKQVFGRRIQMKQDKDRFRKIRKQHYTLIFLLVIVITLSAVKFLYPQYPGLAYDPADPFNNQEEPLPPFEIQGLVVLTELDDSFVIDLKYATEDNFAGQVIYTHPICVIHKNTAQKLIVANDEFKEMGYRIKIWDAYRPFSAQQLLWDAASDKQYVGDPKKGSVHNRGAAVDITLVDSKMNLPCLLVLMISAKKPISITLTALKNK